MLTVSFKHYECQKRQCQNDPAFIPPLSCSLRQQSLCHFLSSSEQKKKRPQFIHRSHVRVRRLQTQSVTEGQPYRTALCHHPTSHAAQS